MAVEIPPDITDDELRAAELADYCRRPTDLIRRGLLSIVDDERRLVPLVPNAPQRRFLNLVDWIRNRRQPARIIILKARQWGGSTITEAVIFCDGALWENQAAMVLADLKGNAQHLWEISERYYECLAGEPDNAHLLPAREPSKGKALKLANGSTVVVQSAENRERVGRSRTLTHLHASEKAFYPAQESTFLAVTQAVPDQPGTLVVQESTANGVGDEFYADCLRLIQAGEEDHKGSFDDGNDGVTYLMFVPWMEVEKYRMDLPPGATLEEAWEHLPETELAPIREREEWLRSQGVTEEQLHWRRWRIIEKCRGKVELFDQEYPDTPRRAFLGSGSVVFDAQALEELQEGVRDAVWERGRLEMGYQSLTWQADANGALEILEHPKEGHHYVIGGDFAEGIGQDADSLHVIDRQTLTEVAVWNAQMGTDHAGRNLEALARYYNTAIVCPEANNYGLMAVAYLRDHYETGKLYRRQPSGDRQPKGESEGEVRYGFQTTRATKPQLISGLEAAIRNRQIAVRHPATLHELRVYERDPKTGKMGAPEGQHDDRVIGLALALMAHESMPMVREEKLKPLEWEDWLGR